MKKIKHSSTDYQISQLPSTRRKQFSDVLSHRYRVLLLIGMILVLFFLPQLGALIYKDATIMAINHGSYDDKYGRIFSVHIIYIAISLVTSLIFYVGLSGVLKIFKEMVYDEPIFFKNDFIQGIKENFKSFIVISIILSLFSALDTIITYAYGNLLYVQIIAPAFNYALIFPICYVAMFLCTFYSNKFFVVVKASSILYFRFFPTVFLGFVLSFGLYLLKYIPLIYLKYGLFLLLIMFFLPLVILGSIENFAHIFDETINKEQYPDYYKKGLYSDK